VFVECAVLERGQVLVDGRVGGGDVLVQGGELGASVSMCVVALAARRAASRWAIPAARGRRPPGSVPRPRRRAASIRETGYPFQCHCHAPRPSTRLVSQGPPLHSGNLVRPPEDRPWRTASAPSERAASRAQSRTCCRCTPPPPPPKPAPEQPQESTPTPKRTGPSSCATTTPHYRSTSSPTWSPSPARSPPVTPPSASSSGSTS
jgi:hypothetical protein